MKTPVKLIQLVFYSGLWLGLVGCSGADNVARVTGQVTLDGEALSGARVLFIPLSSGGESSAMTDQDGNYTVQYTREVQGAEIGEHRVRITTASRGDPDSTPPEPKRAELLPPKYHSKSELTAKVVSGSNTINFDLQTGASNKTSK